MRSYIELAERVLRDGEMRPNRTGINTLSVFGGFLSHDIAKDGFPLLSTKRVPFNSVIAELMGFIHGVTSAAAFRQYGTKIWDANANENHAWLANPFRKGTDDLGPVYGNQWRRWIDIQLVNDGSPGSRQQAEALEQSGYELRGDFEEDSPCRTAVYFKVIDQMYDLIEGIKNNPYGRAHVVTAWNPGVLDKVALPACHFAFQCYVRGDYLDLQFHMRSADLFLGVPFNLASYAALLTLLAAMTGKIAGRLTATFGDLHIYENHLDQIKEQITREPRPLPRVTVEIDPDAELLDMGGAAFTLDNYVHHPALHGKMAV
jgi:thymidylate synthase